MLLGQQPCQLIIAWDGMLVGIDFTKCLSEYP